MFVLCIELLNIHHVFDRESPGLTEKIKILVSPHLIVLVVQPKLGLGGFDGDWIAMEYGANGRRAPKPRFTQQILVIFDSSSLRAACFYLNPPANCEIYTIFFILNVLNVLLCLSSVY